MVGWSDGRVVAWSRGRVVGWLGYAAIRPFDYPTTLSQRGGACMWSTLCCKMMASQPMGMANGGALGRNIEIGVALFIML
jgi:hypothetical protein